MCTLCSFLRTQQSLHGLLVSERVTLPPTSYYPTPPVSTEREILGREEGGPERSCQWNVDRNEGREETSFLPVSQRRPCGPGDTERRIETTVRGERFRTPRRPLTSLRGPTPV